MCVVANVALELIGERGDFQIDSFGHVELLVPYEQMGICIQMKGNMRSMETARTK